MKKNLKKFGVGLALVITSALVFVPFIKTPEVVSADASVVEVSSLSQVLNDGRSYKLTQDIDLASAWVPIGTSTKPFTGKFDGNGHIIRGLNINSNHSYQGLFGYVSGAEIKNVKIAGSEQKQAIKYNIENAPVDSQYFLGSVVGYATDGSVISNCEVEDLNTEALTSSFKVTVGSIAGAITDGSVISNSVSYQDINLEIDLKIAHMLRIGGIVGQVADSSSLQNVATFGDITLTTVDSILNEEAVGGIVGEISGVNSSIRNAVAVGNINVDESEKSDIDTISVGAVAGSIVSSVPSAGNISNIAYLQEMDVYGKNAGYSQKDVTTEDYVARLPEVSFSLSGLYFSNSFNYSFVDGANQVFEWHVLSSGWSEDLWTLNILETGNELRLQQFQSFEIKLADQLDYSGLLKPLQGASSSVTAKYGEIVNLKISFKEADDIGFYDMTSILKNGQECGAVKINQGEDGQVSDVVYYETNEGDYTICVKASSKTAGAYSFGMEALTFEGNLVIDASVGGGVVKFTGGTASKRTFTKDSLTTSAEAKAGSLYIFKNWELYYKSTELEAKEDGVVKEGYLQENGSFWKSQGAVYSNYVDESDYKYAPSSLEVKFGQTQLSFVKGETALNFNYLDQDFLLKAVFELDPYKFSFISKNIETREGVAKVVVNDEQITSEAPYASVGKADVVKIQVFIKEGYTLNTDNLLQQIQNSNKQPRVNLTEEVKGNQKVYTLTFNTNKLDVSKMDLSEHNKFVFDLVVTEDKENDGIKNLPWIIGGSVAGGVVLIVGIVLLVIYLNGGFMHRGGSGKGSSGKSSKSKPDTDYKKYFY